MHRQTAHPRTQTVCGTDWRPGRRPWGHRWRANRPSGRVWRGRSCGNGFGWTTTSSQCIHRVSEACNATSVGFAFRWRATQDSATAARGLLDGGNCARSENDAGLCPSHGFLALAGLPVS
jgi:hypothetical protein